MILSQLNALLNYWVFTFALKESRLSIVLIWCGRLFHSLGPATLKLLSANVLYLVLGTVSAIPGSLPDLRPSPPGWCWRYFGAFPFSDLCTNVSNLWMTLCLIGSQCSSLRASVALSYFVLFNTNFCCCILTCWSFAMSQSGNPI